MCASTSSGAGDTSTSGDLKRCHRIQVPAVPCDRLRGPPGAQLQVAEGLDGPDPVQAEAELGADGRRLFDVPAACLLVSLTRAQDCEAREACAELRALAGLACEADSLVIARL